MEVFKASPIGRRTWGRPRTCWWDYIFHLPSKHLGIRKTWKALLESWTSGTEQISKRWGKKWMDGWMAPCLFAMGRPCVFVPKKTLRKDKIINMVFLVQWLQNSSYCTGLVLNKRDLCVCVCVLIYLTKCHYTFSTLLVNLAGVGEVGDGGWQELECWYN